MKLSARDIANFLKNPDKQAASVLLYGPDSGLVRERSRAIAEVILGKTSDPLNRVELSSEQLKSDPALLRDELGAMSLMGGRRLIVLRGAGEKIGPVIAAAFENLQTSTYLIIEADELAPSSSLRALFEKDARFAALACYRDEGRALEDTIRTTLGSFGLRANADALHYLCDNLGNDRGVTQSELEKIALYTGEDKEVTLETAMELTGQNASETTEDVCHAVAGGDAARAHILLAKLLHEGTQAVAIVRALMRHFQRLDLAQAHIQSGKSAEEAVASLRPPVFFKYVPLIKRELAHLPARTLTQILNLLLRTEKDLKSSTLAPALLISHTVQQAARMAA